MTRASADTVLRCDLEGVLHEVVADRLGIAPNSHLGKPFTVLLADADADRGRKLVDAAERNRLIWGRRFTAMAGGMPLAVVADALVVASSLVILIRRREDRLAVAPPARAGTPLADGDLLSRLCHEVQGWRREAIQFRNEVVRYRDEVAGFRQAFLGAQPGPAANPRLGDGHAFTAREGEVIALLLQGLPNRVIGQRLRIEESAVKSRLRAIYEKLGVANRAQAILMLTGKPPEALREFSS